MTDLIVSYKGSDILTASASLSRKLDTAGKYCEDDITIQYTRPTFSKQTKSVTPTESAQTVTPDSGYDGLSQVNVARIPTNYIVPSGTKSITENGTGIDVANYASVDVNVSGGGGEIYRGEHHSGARIVRISLANPIHPSDFSSCTIYEAPTNDIWDWGNQIGSIDSPTGSTQVNVSASLFGIIIVCNGSYVASGTSSCTGNVQFVESDYEGTELYSVNGSGTITIDGIDYDD